MCIGIAPTDYVLNGFIYVLTNSTLTIEPGTVIRGKAGTGLNSAALFITQGAKIFANGTAHSPIIFTSETDDLDDPNDIPLWTRNLWGGVVIYGKQRAEYLQRRGRQCRLSQVRHL